MKNNKILETIFYNNIDKIVNFYIKNFKVKYSKAKKEKVAINCPFCPIDREHPNGDTKFHLILNLDWGIAKCFRCGAVKSNDAILKMYNKYNAYLDFLQEITNLSLYDLQNILKSNMIKQYKDNTDIKEDVASEYIKKHKLKYASEILEAAEYIRMRTRNNDVSIYYADAKYVYIPIFKEKIIIAFIARLYINNNEYYRYKYIKLYDEVDPVAFIDEIEENLSSNVVYVTEGYFDAYAINSSFGDYCAIAIFSKNNISKLIENLRSTISSDTHIVLALDSLKKDNYIYESIDQIITKLSGYFQNISICLLPEKDPNSIFVESGPTDLIKILKKYTVSSGTFLKNKIIKKTNKVKKIDTINTVKLPVFLLNLKNKIRTDEDDI